MKVAFYAFKLGSGLLPDAIMVLIVISPASLPDTGPLVLLGYHLGEVVPQIFGDGGTLRYFADGMLKRAAMLFELVCCKCVYWVLCRFHDLSL